MSIPNKKIIIFDDDEDILSIISYVLQEEGWEVVTFMNCDDIITKVSGIMPDAILMDNWIAETGGIVATQALKNTEQLKHIAVVYFSANSEIQKLAEQAGADAYLAKPFDLDALTDILNEVSPTAI